MRQTRLSRLPSFTCRSTLPAMCARESGMYEEDIHLVTYPFTDGGMLEEGSLRLEEKVYLKAPSMICEGKPSDVSKSLRVET